MDARNTGDEVVLGDSALKSHRVSFKLHETFRRKKRRYEMDLRLAVVTSTFQIPGFQNVLNVNNSLLR